MKTAIHGRWNRHSSHVEEARNLWRAREDYDQEIATSKQLMYAQDKLTARFLSLLDEVGIDLVSDGGFRWDSAFDIARKLGGCGHFKVLHRITETNHFHRAPAVITAPRWQGPILRSDAVFARSHTKKDILVSLAGPYTLARQSILMNNHVSFEKLTLLYAEALNEEIAQLLKLENVYVKVDDPQILLPSVDWPLIRQAYSSLAHGINRSKFFLCTWFHEVKNPEEYFALPFGGFFLDFTSGSEVQLENLNTLKFFPKGKILGAGIIDARQSALLKRDDLLFWAQSVLAEVPSERVLLCPNADLTFLPWDIAEAKLRQLVEIKAEVGR